MTENDFQEATACLFRRLGWLAWHTPNEERNKQQAIRQKKRGVLAGVSDWLIAEPWESAGKAGTMIAIELKVGKGRPSRDQKRFLGQVERRGWLVAVCRSMEEVVEVLRCVRPRNGRALG